jgi:hypothetical protein
MNETIENTIYEILDKSLKMMLICPEKVKINVIEAITEKTDIYEIEICACESDTIDQNNDRAIILGTNRETCTVIEKFLNKVVYYSHIRKCRTEGTPRKKIKVKIEVKDTDV